VLFQEAKIQIFESNSQLANRSNLANFGCFRKQRYKFLKAIHNLFSHFEYRKELFQEAKIQIFESNSQLGIVILVYVVGCFRKQRYKFLKAIHNQMLLYGSQFIVVSGSKDTNF